MTLYLQSPMKPTKTKRETHSSSVCSPLASSVSTSRNNFVQTFPVAISAQAECGARAPPAVCSHLHQFVRNSSTSRCSMDGEKPWKQKTKKLMQHGLKRRSRTYEPLHKTNACKHAATNATKTKLTAKWLKGSGNKRTQLQSFFEKNLAISLR